MSIKILTLTSFFVLISLNYMIYQKQKILNYGETIIMQHGKNNNYIIEKNIKISKNIKRGSIVICADRNKVAKFVRIHKKEKLNKGEKLIYFTNFYGNLKIMPFKKRLYKKKNTIFKFYNNSTYLVVQ